MALAVAALTLDLTDKLLCSLGATFLSFLTLTALSTQVNLT
jgi:hypothetical protein